MDLQELAKHYNKKFGFNVIPLEYKKPRNHWKEFQNKKMTQNDIDRLKWDEETKGLGAICGINNLRCLDFDKVSNSKIVYDFAEELGLGRDYPWIVKSGNGYHIWFYCEDNSEQV